jgi:hypothetical protein
LQHARSVVENLVDVMIDDDCDSLLKLVLQFEDLIRHFYLEWRTHYTNYFVRPKYPSIFSHSSTDAEQVNGHRFPFNLISPSLYLGSLKCFHGLCSLSSATLLKDERQNLVKYAAMGGNLALFRELYVSEDLNLASISKNHHFDAIIMFGSVQILKFLYLNGDTVLENTEANSDLHLCIIPAVLHGHLDIVKFFIENIIFVPFEMLYHAALEECCRGGSWEVLQYLLSLPYKNTLTLSHLIEPAVEGGSLSVVKLLFQTFDCFESCIVEALKSAIENRKSNIL